MTQLTPNFNLEEFEIDGPIPEECVPVFTKLCSTLLEPIREHFGAMPIIITSGYRPPAANAAAHGVSNSQHVATAEYCAADFKITGDTNMRPVFDWVRALSNLVWDQLILEHGNGEDIIHLSVTMTTNRREALEGATANQTAYERWSVQELPSQSA